MTFKVAVFRHGRSDDGLGSLAPVLKKIGAEYYYVDAFFKGLSDFDPLAPDLLVILGGTLGVYQADHYPFINEEIRIVEKRLAADLPTFGICFGAQLMAKALGAEVYIGKQGPEIGWYDLNVNGAGKKTSARHLDVEHISMLQWHGDTFDLPQGAELLASSDSYENQIFSWGKNALALQCHIEATPRIFEGRMVGVAGDIEKGDLDPHKIKEGKEDRLKALMMQSETFFLEWLQEIDIA